MGSIGVRSTTVAEVGVATENGRSYFIITSLLRRARIPYIDILLTAEIPSNVSPQTCASINDELSRHMKLIITTKKERLRIAGSNVICVEELAEDFFLAKQRLMSLLYPLKDTFVIGVDPGKRTGIAVFMDQMEVDSAVLSSIDETITRITSLLDNANKMRRIVKIGAGMPLLADKIASSLEHYYGKEKVRIQFVDERGTSSSYASVGNDFGTRDQRSARLIALREGRDYAKISSAAFA